MPTIAKESRRVQVSTSKLLSLFEEEKKKKKHLYRTDFDPRRGLVDMRKRFRGNAPISASKELGEGGKSASPQLYAGKPAFQSVGGEEVQMEPEKTRG
jgi:cytochrome c oxidase assembly factor 5